MEYPKECILSSQLIFDTHAHYDDERFDDVRNELLETMHQNGVGGIVTCGCDKESSKSALSLAERYPYVYAAVGIHPCNIDSGTTIHEIRQLASQNKCVAIGEIGLDYYWEPEKKEEQIEIFEKQIILAKELDLPILVHDREAHEDTLKILLKHRPKGVVHCFSGSVQTAKQLTDIGMYIGVGGVVTFKNARKLPEVVAAIPDDKLLLETDCPYLAPEPYRGKLCHSGLIALTAQKVAEIRNTSCENVLKLSFENAKNLFGIQNKSPHIYR